MIEFGSDFHLIESYNSGRAHLTDVFRNATLLADGRQGIEALILQNGWHRLWMPEYFCYDVIECIKRHTGIEVKTYSDSPLNGGEVENLPFEKGDVLLRMNFFGMRYFRSNKNIPVPVLEDHSHDPLGHWALYSDADWCISSIRKTLPIPEGGMIWSPKGYTLKLDFQLTEENDYLANTRWEGMEMKARYLQGEDINKDNFRKKYMETEDLFDKAEISLIDNRSKRFVTQLFDINMWYGAKRRNWKLLKKFTSNVNCHIIEPEHSSCNMFSLIILTKDKEMRNKLRQNLIENCVYPAILWNIPETASDASKDFSERMLSIHCDGRYSKSDIIQLSRIINNATNNL